MPGVWEESKHPRADDGKFGEGSGAPKLAPMVKKKAGRAAAKTARPAGVAPKQAKPAAKPKAGTAKAAKIAAARVKAQAKAADIVAKAKAKAKSIKGSAKKKVDDAKTKADASGKKLTGAQKTKHAAAKKKAKEKADAIVAKAKERAAAIKAKAGPAKTKSAATTKKAQPKKADEVTEKNAPPQPSAPPARSTLPTPQPAPQPAAATSVSKASKPEPVAAKPSPATPAAASQTAQPLGDSGIAELRKKFTASASPEEFEAVGYYQGMFSQTINKALRKGGEPEKDADMVKWATKNLDSVLEKNKSTKPMITYRGSGPHESFANLKEGETFVDNGFMSTSADKSMTMGGDFQFHITSPAGTKMGAITNDETGHEGAWGLEQEVLLGRGTALRLDKRELAIHEEGYPITIMHMTVVGQK
jgi:hypothetical protein